MVVNRLARIDRSTLLVRIIFCAFLVYEIIQHSLVWFYHDDFGYAVLHYGNNVGTTGFDYGLGDIINYLHWHYMNWGGRVLFMFLQIVLIRLGEGLTLIRIFQAFLITGIMYGTYRIARGKNKDSVLLALTATLLWGSIARDIIRDGVFWFSASTTYTWPICFLLIGILLLKRYISVSNSLLRQILLFILFFAAGFSQEQVAVLTITFVICEAIYTRTHKRKIEWITIVGAILGGCIEILAPGNFVRSASEDNAAFEALSFFQKIQKNFFPIVNVNVGRVNLILMTLISCTVIMIGLLLWKRCRKKQLLAIGLIINCGYLGLAATNYVFGLWNYILPWATLVWVINVIVFLVSFGIIWDNSLVISLCCAAVFSQGIMVLSPGVSYRSAIIFQYPMMVIMLSVFAQFCKDIDWSSFKKRVCIPVYLLFAMVMLGNGMMIGLGYYRNHSINEVNDEILKRAEEDARNGKEITQVPYFKLNNDLYANDMPYNKAYIEYWIRDYYCLPQSVEFVYLDGWKAAEYAEEMEKR